MAKINVNAQESIASIRELIGVMKTLNKETAKIGKATSGSFGKIQGDIKSLKSSISTISKKFSELNQNLTRNSNITKTNSKRLTKNSAEIKRNSDLTKTNSKNKRQNSDAINKLSKSINKDTIATRKNSAAKKKSSGILGKLGKRFLAIGAALGVMRILQQAAKSVINLTIRFQSLGFAMEKISSGNQNLVGAYKEVYSTADDVADSFAFLISLNTKFGASLDATSERWLKFKTAAQQSGLVVEETKQIFESVTKASAVLGLRTDELKGVYLALEQMLSKGKVTTEELRRQLGERLPGAVGIMADALGVTTAQLSKMMKAGEVVSGAVLPKFAKALEKAYGIMDTDTIDNLATDVGKMTGAWDRFVLTITEGDSLISRTIGGTMKLITTALNALTNYLETVEQTARRTGDERFGEENLAYISKETELIMKQQGVLIKTEKEYQDLLKKADEKTTRAPLESKERLAALSEEMALRKEFEKFKEQKRDVSRRFAFEQIAEVRELRDELLKQVEMDEIIASKMKVRMINNRGEAVMVGELTEAEKERFKVGFEGFKKTEEAYIKTFDLALKLNALLEKSNKVQAVDDSGSGSKRARKIKMAKEYNGTLEDEILILERVADLNDRVFGQAGQSIEDTTMALDEYIKALNRIAELEFDEKNNDLRTAEADEKNKWKARMDSWDKGASNYEEQVEQHEIALKNIEKKYTDLRLINQQNFLNKKAQITFQSEDRTIQMIKKFEEQQMQDATMENDLAIRGIEMAMLQENEGTDQYNELYRLREEMLEQHQNNLIDIQVKSLEKQANFYLGIGEMDMATNLFNMAKGLDATKTTIENVKPSVEEIAEMVIDVTNTMSDLGNNLFERRIAQIDEEIRKEGEKYDTLLRLAKDDEAEQKIIERNKEIRMRKLDEKKRREQIKQAKFEKAMNIAKGTAALALAIQYAYAHPTPTPFNIAQAAIVAALSAVELATIAATPIPSFATGGVMGHDGKALINDGGQMEYVERGGKIMTAKNENALVDLKRGDVIHKDFETMQRKSLIFNSIFDNQNESTQNEIDFTQLELAIEKGFRNAKINNKISILNEYDAYKESQQNWS